MIFTYLLVIREEVEVMWRRINIQGRLLMEKLDNWGLPDFHHTIGHTETLIEQTEHHHLNTKMIIGVRILLVFFLWIFGHKSKFGRQFDC